MCSIFSLIDEKYPLILFMYTSCIDLNEDQVLPLVTLKSVVGGLIRRATTRIAAVGNIADSGSSSMMNSNGKKGKGTSSLPVVNSSSYASHRASTHRASTWKTNETNALAPSIMVYMHIHVFIIVCFSCLLTQNLT
jgi:hypothetical protein